ncbi:16S rRNA (cytidine(1402)-2'-O)-methyltransferase [Ignatzschineria ureiclastica]|uniref:Ribosomal RNA small subunit methyltransferase I n=1 Tax=Ignatzschineria ureiclastica TaxID=472582 RepID=A0A2U2AEQ8_9GAMM|nr:16S rRNA (cytidine(1402)-2'-O)-methyltransferase [Ignatzschineria ureiclastica]PWD81107.1 16S rRNA (cytidine(1402)-2'-O)-methyltransferase [Ignatzschineria ureiclastica]GGZ96274.1 ribosomal RNA small subunit methyltransferase I [Ignatzschineria ureiclastica]
MSTCYVIATPIGNLQDLTPRAIEVLRSVTAVFAEDTRVSGRLLQHFGIHVPSLLSLHEHNEMSRIARIEAYLTAGEDVAIISDAGTPLISDPGFTIVRSLRESGFSVIPVPGVSAMITALSVAGIATDRFTFIGFLSSKKQQRLNELAPLSQVPHTQVFYESSHRIESMLEDLVTTFGEDRKIFVGREMTKRFEDYRYGSALELWQHYQNNPGEIRGEFVVVTSGAEIIESENQSLEASQLTKVLLAEGLPLKQISGILHQVTGRPKNALYQELLQLRED